ncbi:hypothetical protein B0H19DRAFT_1384480 [Mycena capillaripes]|nr:hypothetical protein B0H19DRAFT_1384480 [Mycena capillaripes]
MSASSTYPITRLDGDLFDKELPDAPEILTPLRKHEPSAFFNRDRQSSPFFNRSASPFLPRSRWGERELTFQQPTSKPSDGRLRWLFALPALVITLLTFSLATILLLYFAVIHRVPDPGGSDASAIFVYQLATDTLVGLTITTVATHTVSISVPFLISVAAYCVAGKWLREQEFPHQTRVALPTPLQYAFMVKMLATARVTSVYQAGRYLRESRGTIQFPRAFHLALGLTSLILGLSYSLILADIWLHGVSSIGQRTIERTVPSLSLGVAFNESVCTSPQACLNDTAGWAFDSPWVTQTGLLVAANTPAPFSVVTLDNASDLAVVVPTSANASMSLVAPSFGVRAQCASLTPNCSSSAAAQCPGYPQAPLLALGGNITMTSTNGTTHNGTTTNCITTNTPVTVQPTTRLTTIAKTGANPQTVLVQLQWLTNALTRPANPSAIQTSSGNVLAWASCDLTFYNLTLRHQDGSYSTVGEPVLANSDFAAIMQGGLLSQTGNTQLLASLRATMLAQQNLSSAVAAMNQQVSRLALALFAGTLQPVPATAESTIAHSVLYGRYPIPPLTVYLLLLYAYSLTAGVIYLWASRLRSPLHRAPGYKTTSAVQLAQLRLADPLALVVALYPAPYPGSEGGGEAPDDARALFVEDESTPRLAIGTDGTSDGFTSPIGTRTRRPSFGVYKRAGPRATEFLAVR